MKTKLMLFKHDITYQRKEDFLKKINSGKVFEVCVYDSNEITNLCELLPSYWIEPCFADTENYLEEEFWEEFNDEYWKSSEAFYLHCKDVEPAKSLKEYDFRYKNEEEYFEKLDQVKEELRINQWECCMFN